MLRALPPTQPFTSHVPRLPSLEGAMAWDRNEKKLIGDIKGDTCGSMWSPTILSLCFATGRREISVKVILEPGFTYEIGDCGLISFWKKMPMLSDTLLTRYKAEAIADGATADGGDEANWSLATKTCRKIRRT